MQTQLIKVSIPVTMIHNDRNTIRAYRLGDTVIMIFEGSGTNPGGEYRIPLEDFDAIANHILPDLRGE